MPPAIKAKRASGNKSDAAYLKLRKLIDAGRLNGGERLTEARAARLVGMGRGPVRESLLRLEAEGILHHAGRKRSRVIVYTEDENRRDLLHRYEMREQIESGAARLAAKNMTGWEIDRLRELSRAVDRHAKMGDSERRYEANAAFHQYLVETCGNPLLAKAWHQYRLGPTRPRALSFEQALLSHIPPADRDKPLLAAVVDAIASHDQTLAEQLMKKRVRQITDALRLTPFDEDAESSDGQGR